MSNPTVPAAAEGMPAFNRRRFLLATAGTVTLGAAGAATAASALAAADPCLAFVLAWKAVEDETNAIPDGQVEAFYNAHCQPFEMAAVEGRVPAAATAEGAAAALRKALAFGDMENQDEALVRAALDFLERRA